MANGDAEEDMKIQLTVTGATGNKITNSTVCNFVIKKQNKNAIMEMQYQ